MPIASDNHYVPRLYLKYFADDAGLLYRYRTLVSNETVKEWKRFNIAGVAYQRNLYTQALEHGDSDEIEQWLSREFESPAEEPLSRIVNGRRLSKDDYQVLTRFVAAQMVRTPAFFLKNVERWKDEGAKQNDESLKRLSRAIEEAKRTGIPIATKAPSPDAKYFPMRFKTEPSPNPGKTIVTLQTMVGRVTWLFAMRHILTETVKKFTHHKWSIIHAEEDLPWFTTDDPVIALNFRNFQDYGFGGGWGVPHTNFLLPLSPTHLLYTQVGDKRVPNGTVFPRHLSQFLRQVIAEHAHRYIFFPRADDSIAALRPRLIDPKAVSSESELWARWHSEQSRAERSFLNIEAKTSTQLP